MKVKKEQIILVVIILALLLYLFLYKRDRLHYQLPEVPEIPVSEISRIEITKPDTSIVIKKKGDNWYIGPQEYLADSSNIKYMLDDISKPVITAMASESKNYNRYGLGTDKKISVRAFSGDTLRREMEVGDLTPSNVHTFVKLGKDYRVFHVKKNLRWEFGKNMDDLRDKMVLSFEEKLVQEMHITKGSKSISLIKNKVPIEKSVEKEEDTEGKEGKDLPKEEKDLPKEEIVWETSDGEKADKATIDELLNTLYDLKCTEYMYDDTKKEDLVDPICTVKLKGDKEYYLSIFSKIEVTDHTHPAISSENDYPFMLTAYLAKKIMDSSDKLLKKDEESK